MVGGSRESFDGLRQFSFIDVTGHDLRSEPRQHLRRGASVSARSTGYNCDSSGDSQDVFRGHSG
jgi:hypothetical protein